MEGSVPQTGTSGSNGGSTFTACLSQNVVEILSCFLSCILETHLDYASHLLRIGDSFKCSSSFPRCLRKNEAQDRAHESCGLALCHCGSLGSEHVLERPRPEQRSGCHHPHTFVLGLGS